MESQIIFVMPSMKRSLLTNEHCFLIIRVKCLKFHYWNSFQQDMQEESSKFDKNLFVGVLVIAMGVQLKAMQSVYSAAPSFTDVYCSTEWTF